MIKQMVTKMKTVNYKHNLTVRPDSSQESPPYRQTEKKIRMMEELQSDLLDPKGIRRIVYDLQVHQFELVMQNEELRGLQQELEASKMRFKDLYDFAPAGYVTISDQGVIVEGNRTAAILLNVVTEMMLGRPFYRFILPVDLDIYYQHRAAIFEIAEPQTCKIRMLRKDLPAFWVRLVTVPVADAEKAQKMCRIMINDINDDMRLAEEKKELEAKCRNLEKAESLDRMAGAIAHHFNNLLGAVMGYLELAQYDIAKETELSKNITSAMQAARRAAEISTSMMTYLGQSFAKREPLDFAATCRSGLAGLMEGIPKKVDMVVDFPTDGPIINANVYQVHQVLQNLMINAWESQSQYRGTIHLSMKTIKPEDIPATHHFPRDCQIPHNLYTRLTVQDTGCGIAEPDIEKIFDPFYTSKFFGRGLGLPIVLGIVRAHSGFLMVNSKVGRGSLFSIFLPVCERDFPQQAIGCSMSTKLPEEAQWC